MPAAVVGAGRQNRGSDRSLQDPRDRSYDLRSGNVRRY